MTFDLKGSMILKNNPITMQEVYLKKDDDPAAKVLCEILGAEIPKIRQYGFEQNIQKSSVLTTLTPRDRTPRGNVQKN